MKFSEMRYERPDLEALQQEYAALLTELKEAPSAQAQIQAARRYYALEGHVSTMSNLCSIRHSIDTRDAYYDQENDYLDEHLPLLSQAQQDIQRALLSSPYREALEKEFGRLLFVDLEIAERSFRGEMVELMQQENKLSSQYQKLYASAMVEFEGKTMPLPKLGPYKQSPQRSVRRAAYETEGRFFDEHREELDSLYDELVQNRTQQARMLGHENYLALGYDRMGRNCYGPEQVAAFRDQIARDLVPLVSRVKRAQEKRLGVEKLRYWDDLLLFPQGNPVPKGTPEEILEAGREMYHGLSPQTGDFIDLMMDGELLDVLSKEGKAPGGYCTEIYDYKAPFIFANFNGTAGDVDVLTHEAGHAFASYRGLKQGYLLPQIWPTMEACECHSMSMEFLTAPYHHLFFGEDTRRYELSHCEESLTFIPYGCLVDEFQHRVYEQPGLSPRERNALWGELERKYRPWIDFGDLPFYSRGAGWQRQLHIYEHPLYYIDYCMAQTVAFQFWMASLKDREDAWKRYLAFVDRGGTATFEELVRDAGLRVPYEEGCMKAVCREVERWLEAAQGTV